MTYIIKYGNESIKCMNLITLQFVKLKQIDRYSSLQTSMCLGIKHNHSTNAYDDTNY